jgi:hypothetical protein
MIAMNLRVPRLRNKALLCGLLTVGTIAAPGAFAHDHHYDSRYSGYHNYDRHGWHDHDHDNGNVGALLAGALIGGVIVNAIDHSHDYSRTYYSTPYYGSTYYSSPTYYAPPPSGARYDRYGTYGNQGYYGDSYYGSGYYDGY